MNLHIYADALETCSYAAEIAAVIEKRDRDLARQLRRCASSIALNAAEGASSQGNNKRARFFNALGSAQETQACFEVARAMRYVDTLDASELDRLDKIIRTLAKLTR